MKVINFIFFVFLFLITTAKASELQIKWRTNILPANHALAGHVCFDEQGTQITRDGAEDPSDVAFSNDGLTYVVGNIKVDGGGLTNRIMA